MQTSIVGEMSCVVIARPRVELPLRLRISMLNEYKGLGSPTKEIGTLPIRREIEETEGSVLTPRDKDLHHSVFGLMAIMTRRLR
jgi:hypothetical protein